MDLHTPPIDFGYDPNANITSETGWTYVYDLSNQLIRVLQGGNQVGEYTFNGAGQRIKKVTQTETKIFHYDLWGYLIAETNQSGQMLGEYIYLGDQLLSMIKPGEAAYYYHNDHLGTPQVLTDATQTVAWKAVYTPFGEAVVSIATVENPFRFPGQYYDAETGLHYNYYRYYNPQTGRYITPDPIGLWGGINLFAYTNNPVNFIDPLGLKEDKCNKDPCAHLLPPNIPPGVDIESNIVLAESMGKGDPYFLIAWFYTQVENKGPWDYKQQGGQYREFGNFNYGATGTAAGISEGALRRAAGWAQEKAGTSQRQWGHWYKGYPYGDDPEDQKWIQKGIEYYQCRRKNKK